ncbi:methylmalonate-semialdehyde dehydrogenase (CoA acylating) [Micrococcus luteus]|uniref:methylmalonate-semialdehyde dehydrogenase (CoA acylating) n=1 Tax=Micrococcus luteus (strain ATCC 4698 / DSM 20030 / JCM 1464 / CCM 169 / CCUG 5858 / IAM 1056 / NBRC 3333 / NCIMB 9278 / NCTC 2665 / VKM Ac-2230) TaxID=465515 RepID=C5C8A1_MICLC|nr:methylmalonate-semialdehyde dehydrogenase (acylating) [Micrococcus luteus NCTC 2665]AJO54842.1 methylmalonate-semialdehyde dehydrogenase [Micrococcus luteus]KAB1902508.1 CoA-acylating methylmalonate-semialdehyde dehydrogenase [Micrococcus luteus NCTC 2665]ORE62725.1 methylmalonate-semialdehyde dehydrogenase (CoA acylating) [Micrococcus luteus]QCY44311.1 CoA-acylating methylmalonate-semialdehyde dehydrogenase [Micrococcus luteus]
MTTMSAGKTTVIEHFIGGKARGGDRTTPVYNPATGQQIAELVQAPSSRVDEAVRDAVRAQREWRRVGLVKRSKIMFRAREIIDARKDELARIITREHGKVHSDALGEIARGMENVEFCAGLLHHMKGEFAEQVADGVDVKQIRQPVGVVACITPFNFPAMVPLWMFTTAIAAGNAVVLKPSERDPSAANWLAEVFLEAGLPEGILNVVHGDKEAVDALLSHPQVKAVSFVGSTPVAHHIYTTAANEGKRVQALGGAKNHMVVMPDADLESAAAAAVSAAFGSAGERCMAISVAVVVGDIGDQFVDRVTELARALVVRPGDQPEADMGPLITRDALERVTSYVDSAAQEGGTLVLDGRTHDVPTEGFFIGPSIVDHVRPGMKVYDDEIFGPVLAIVRVDTYEDAVNLINENRFANGTSVFTRDGKTVRSFEYDIEVGMVGVNIPIPVPVGSFSFGGWKDSLFGDTHMYGPEGFNFYTRRKVVSSRWPEASESQVDLGFPSH